ncbi:MAG: Zn-dependent exopeptidase M28 [Planctomycetes bacterium]|nr:Zn-dependent exopeptidase M28 [Planctomycetota bacterium]
MQRHSVWIGLALLGACLGASIGLRQQAGTDQDRTVPRVRPPADDDPIDQKVVQPLPVVRAPAGLGERAFAHVQALVAMGPRHTAAQPTPGWSRQLDHIVTTLRGLGLEPVRDTWTDRKELLTFTNVSVRIPGRRPDRILLACHHDTKCTTGHSDPAHNFPFVGANDGASGVGLLLALAAELAKTEREATLELVFFDGEESLDWTWNDAARALFGSKRYVRSHRDRTLTGDEPRIAAMVLLDMVGRTDLHIQEELYSTRALRQLCWSAAVATGHQDVFFRRAEAASDDHKPFLEVGIPAIDLIDLNGNPHWHKSTDTIENVSAASLQRVADVVLTLLPAIEQEFVQKPR